MNTFSPRSAFRLQPATLRAILSRPPYDDMPERLRHWQHISSLAQEMQLSIGAVKLLYENALMHLKPNAKVQNFLPIFVSKQLKLPRRVRQESNQDSQHVAFSFRLVKENCDEHAQK